jgi:hypothetical protein
VCIFCDQPGASWFVHSDAPIPDPAAPAFWHTPDGFGRYCGVVALCAHHEQLLRGAGEKGVRHGPSGVRWWLGV